MKWLKLFEGFNRRFKIGQDVIALNTGGGNIERIKGKIYNISDILYCGGCGKQFLNFGQVQNIAKIGTCRCGVDTPSRDKFWTVSNNYAPLDDLDSLLKKSLEEEDYEFAALLRDLINDKKTEPILENNSHKDPWIDTEDLKLLFGDFEDEGGYDIDFQKNFFKKMNGKMVNFHINDMITPGEYQKGWVIRIRPHRKDPNSDATDYFTSTMEYIFQNGYKLFAIFDDDDHLDINHLYFIDGRIITWIPEREGKELPKPSEELEAGDLLIYSNTLLVYIYEGETIEINHLDMAKFYRWGDYTTDGESIFTEVSIEELANRVLIDNEWVDELVNGIDESLYDSHPRIELGDIFGTIDFENSKLLIRYLIESWGDFGEFKGNWGIEESLNIDRVIEYLLNNRGVLLKIMKDSDSYIIGDVIETITGFETNSLIEKNQKELELEFDRILDELGLEYTKEKKMGKGYYWKKSPNSRKKTKIYYDSEVWFYKLKYQDRWGLESISTMSDETLFNVFVEWLSDGTWGGTSPNLKKLNPNFSDFSTYNTNLLNGEVKRIIQSGIDKKRNR
jgi:hypothetical protein